MKKNRRKKSKVTILVMLGVALAVLFAPTQYSLGYVYGWTNLIGNHRQAVALAEVEESFETPAPAEAAVELPVVEAEPVEGEVLDVALRIPRFGDGYAEPVYEGTTDSTLRLGVAHYTNTTMPCEDGNFAVTAHRTTYGANFFNIDKLVDGDEVVVETKTSTCVYVIDGHIIVDGDSSTEILDTPPGSQDPALVGVGGFIMLISCDPITTAENLYIAYGHLASVTHK